MNPQEVCALHRRNHYDLILLDLQMPGMDGFQVMEGLKTNDADGYLPVIVLTAQPGHKLRALQAGAKDFISKPFDLVEVKTRIHNMLEVRLLYKQLENYNKVLEQTVQERTAELRESEARYRSLTELASDWYWEQDENGPVHQGVRPGPGNARHPGRRVRGRAGQRCRDRAGTRRSGEALQAKIAARQPFLDFVFSRVNADGSQPAVPGQRRADVQPGLPLHRLPRHRRRADRPESTRAAIGCHATPAQSRSEPPARRAADAEFERLAPHLELVPMLLGETLYEPGGQLQHVYFPTTAIVSLLYVHGVRRVGRDRRRGQRGHARHLAVHGRRHHAELGGRADRGPRLPAAGAPAEGGIRPRRADAAAAAALHAGAADADVPDRGLQPAPFDRAAAVPLAAADARSIAVERAGHDAGTGRQRARRAPRRHHRGRREAAARRASSATAAATSRCSIGPGWRRGACECYAVVKKEFARLLPYLAK